MSRPSHGVLVSRIGAADERDLRRLFRRCGEIGQVRVDAGKGEAVVVFQEERGARQALRLDGERVRGNAVKVAPAAAQGTESTARIVIAPAAVSASVRRGILRDMERFGRIVTVTDEPDCIAVMYAQETAAAKATEAMHGLLINGRRVTVTTGTMDVSSAVSISFLPRGVTEGSIAALCHHCGNVSAVAVCRPKDGREDSWGALVRFADPDAADRAVRFLTGLHLPGGHSLDVAPYTGRPFSSSGPLPSLPPPPYADPWPALQATEARLRHLHTRPPSPSTASDRRLIDLAALDTALPQGLDQPQ